MPYTAKQNKVFRAIAHGFRPRKKGLRGISREEASKMAAEGIKRKVSVGRGARRR